MVSLYLAATVMLISLWGSNAQGTYKFWNSRGGCIYDYNGTNRPAEVLAGTGLNPVYTNAGVYLNTKNTITIAKNNCGASSGDFPTVLSFWAYSQKSGVLFTFRTVHNTVEFISRIIWNKAADDSIIMKYYNKNTNTYSPDYPRTESFCNI